MKIKRIRPEKLEEAEISQIAGGDEKIIKSSKQFKFNWKLEKENDIYKIYLVDNEDTILGLISLIDIPAELRIHINLIEVSFENVGKEKKYDWIAGCLIAFACAMSIEKAYGGFVSLIPKTKLINHYCKKYGFKQFGRQLAVDNQESVDLVKKYL